MKRSGFTFIEILTVMVIIMILAGIVVPVLAGLGDGNKAAVMAATVRQVRERIEYQAAVSVHGNTGTLESRWFDDRQMPKHAWTRRPMKVQVVNGSKTAIFPNNKTFVLRKDGTAAGDTAWYNASNGAFCVLVPKSDSAEEDIELFAAANGLDLEPSNTNGDNDDDDDDD